MIILYSFDTDNSQAVVKFSWTFDAYTMTMSDLKTQVVAREAWNVQGLAFTFRYVFVIDQKMSMNTFLTNEK